MQADRLADLGTEALGQPVGAKLLVRVVDAAWCRILAQPMDHVADIVQQAGKHCRGRRLVGLGHVRRTAAHAAAG